MLKPGQRVRGIRSGRTGTVLSLTPTRINPEEFCVVQWDGEDEPTTMHRSVLRVLEPCKHCGRAG